MIVNYLISSAATLAIAILIYGFMGFRLKKGSAPALLLVFIWGFVSILLNVLSVYLTNLAGLFPLDNSIKRVAFYSLITAGFFREFGKFISIRIITRHRDDFNTPADGIVFSMMASLGFTLAAMIWNIAFMLEPSNELYRSLLTLPANIITAIILGFFIGLGRLRRNAFIDSTTGLFAATAFHAVFEFSFITADPTFILIVFAGSILIVGVLINKAIGLSAAR